MVAVGALERLKRACSGLSSKDVEGQAKAADNVHSLIVNIKRTMGADGNAIALNEINRIAFELSHSQSINDKRGAVLLISHLADLMGEGEGGGGDGVMIRYMSYLRAVIPCPDQSVNAMAVEAIAALLLHAPEGTRDAQIQDELERCYDLIRGDSPNEASLVVALNQIEAICRLTIPLKPATIEEALAHCEVLARSSGLIIRLQSARAIHGLLLLLKRTDHSFKNVIWASLIEAAMSELRSMMPSTIHGALLTLQQLCRIGCPLISDHFDALIGQAFHMLDHRELCIRQTAMDLIPDAAHCCPTAFTDTHLESWIDRILRSLPGEDERGAIEAIGSIALVIRDCIRPYLLTICDSLRGLVARKRGERCPDYILTTLTALSEVGGQEFEQPGRQILGLLLLCELDNTIVRAVKLIVKAHPKLWFFVEDYMIELVAEAINGTDDTIKLIGYEAIESFTFSENLLVGPLGEKLVNSIGAITVGNKAVLFGAARALLSLICNHQGDFKPAKPFLVAIVQLTVSVCDVKLTEVILKRLLECKQLHKYLAFGPILTLLASQCGATDASHLLSLRLLRQLAVINPADILILFRRRLFECLSELGFGDGQRGLSEKECSAEVLYELALFPEHWLRPYSTTILQMSLQCIRSSQLMLDADILVSSSAKIVAQIAAIEPAVLEHRLQEIFDLFSELLTESHGEKRQVAVVTSFAVILRLSDRRKLTEDSLPKLMLTLFGILKVELNVNVRMQLLDLFGVVGSIDPFRIKQTAAAPDASDDDEDALLADGLSRKDDDFNLIAFKALLKILQDPVLAEYHMSCAQCITFIIRELGAQAKPIMDLNIVLTCNGEILEFYFQQLVAIVQSMGIIVKPHVPRMIKLVEARWVPDKPAAISIVSLLETLVGVLKGDSLSFMSRTVSLLMCYHQFLKRQRKSAPITARWATSLHKLCSTIATIAPYLTSFSGVALQIMLSELECIDAADPVTIKASILGSLMSLLCSCDVGEHLTRLARSLAQKWNAGSLEECVDSVLDAFRLILSIDGKLNVHAFLVEPNAVLLRNSMTNNNMDLEFRRITSKIASMYVTSHTSVPPSTGGSSSLNGSFYDISCEHTSGMNLASLKRAFDVGVCTSKEAWFEWLRKLGMELLRESPVGSLRICASLAATYYPLNKELFNAAFVSCWEDMVEEEQRHICKTIERALGANGAPAELTQTLLDLCEYMEHLEKALPISVSVLGSIAMKSHAFAKALYYREEEFKCSPTTATLESLVSINSHIQNQDGAIGILSYSQKKFGITLTESWYEKLQRWEEALGAYEKRMVQDPSSREAFLGALRCRFALGDWDELNREATARWDAFDESVQRSAASLACASTWAVNDFEGMCKFVQVLPETTSDGSFFRAIHAIHQTQHDRATQMIQMTRATMDTELTALIGESYGRAYIPAIRVQMLSDLTEIMEYAVCEDVGRRERIKRSLTLRLRDCQETIEVWQRLMKIRNLVIPMDEDKDLWIRFAQMAHESKRTAMSTIILNALLHIEGDNPHPQASLSHLHVGSVDPQVAYAYIQHCWAAGEHAASRDALFKLANFLSLKIESQASVQQPELQRLVARCFVTLGEWQGLGGGGGAGGVDETVLQYYLQATAFDKTWYQSWHSWALANYEAAGVVESESRHEFGDLRGRTNPYVVPAIQGFFRSIASAPMSSLQDALRLLTLWFKYGASPDVNGAIGDGFFTVPVNNWLSVLPQLIARIHVPNSQVRRMIHSVLAEIGKQHPQALVYSLTVSGKSQNVSRRTSAIALLDKLKSHSAVLVEEAQLISNELIRVAILWEEMWYEGLEEASRMYFGEQNVPPMLAILEPLHGMLDRGAETPREHLFVKTYGDDLREARELCRRYRKSGNMAEVTAAWELYYHVFRRINKALPLLTVIDLQQSSPRLAGLSDISLAVPGTFTADDHKVITIVRVAEKMPVIASKQRPRKLAFLGSDGRWHKFLLKGHEDLRQDERVMQFFGLMNSLLMTDGETRKRHLDIQRYSVIPLSQNSGLIGWVTHCDTMHSLIKEYRESRGIQLSLEHRLMLQMAPDFDHLTRLQKVETFTWAMRNSDGDDLARVLWLKSDGAETWLERRTIFIRSVAVMSMAGYVLGLGDRHPSNLMMDRQTGRVVHIDFGDCFEVAMLREKFPERVPFRLTRMMQRAFEASGVDGTFRRTCEETMRVMRGNKDSLMAILEAFIYDPLINWRLLSHSHPQRPAAQQQRPSFVRPSMAAIPGDDLDDAFSLAKRLTRDDASRLEEESVNRGDNVHAGALNALNRVASKLTGRDYKVRAGGAGSAVCVNEQVELLVTEATMVENLCQAYVGWCAFW